MTVSGGSPHDRGTLATRERAWRDWAMVARAVLVAASVIIAAGCAPQPPITPTQELAAEIGPEPRMRDTASDAVLDTLVDATKPGCSAAVARRGDVVWSGASGLADLESGKALTTATRFNAASVSKQFTATAIFMLQREGLLSLYDPVGAYVTGLPSWGQTITLEQLMHHTSHLPDFWKKLEANGIAFRDSASHADIVKAIASVRKLEPGTGYLYSNSNYVLLAEVVHIVSGEPLPTFLENRIFSELGLAMQLSPNLVAADVALSYDDNDQPVVSGWAPYGPSEIFTTPTELARWANQYRDSTIIDEAFAVGAVDTAAEGETSVDRLYAAGITIESDGSLRHDGRFGGHITTFRVSSDRETAVVVSCNGHLANRFGVADELGAIWGGVIDSD